MMTNAIILARSPYPSGTPDTTGTPDTDFGAVILLILLSVAVLILILPYVYRVLVLGVILPLFLAGIALAPITLVFLIFEEDSSLFLSIPACVAGIIASVVLSNKLFEWYFDFLEDHA
jgi:H+/Cl- antiporter ClcA